MSKNTKINKQKVVKFWKSSKSYRKMCVKTRNIKNIFKEGYADNVN
jgi:hypothetical protein